MQFRLACLAGAAVLSFGGIAHAQNTVPVTFQINITDEFNLATSQYTSVNYPTPFDITADIPLSSYQIYNYGQVIETEGTFGGTPVSNPLTSEIPASASLGETPSLNRDAYTFIASDDYPSTYLTEFGIEASNSKYVSNGSGQSVGYSVFRLGIDLYSPSRGGTGAAAQSYTPEQIIAFLQAAESNPSAYTTNFYEDAGQEVLNASGQLVSQSGLDLEGTARVLSVGVSPAPEPSSWLLMIAGVGVAGAFLRRSGKIATVGVSTGGSA